MKIVKKYILSVLLLSFFVAGCGSINIPTYIAEKKPFKQRFYANHSQASSAVRQAFTELGWSIEEEVSPEVFEVDIKQRQSENLMIISKDIISRMFVKIKQARANVYIRSNNDISEVEIRYMAIYSFRFFKPKSYGNKKLANKFFKLVQNSLD